MDGDDVVVDRKMLRAINADSRISILKALLQRQKTQSELATELGISAPTALEHMAQLEKAKLIEIVPEYADKKWRYYRLTRTGRGIVEGKRMNVVLLLASASAVITGALIGLYLLLALIAKPSEPTAQTLSGPSSGLQYALSSLESSSRTFIGALVMLFFLLTLALAAVLVIQHLIKKKG